MSRHIVTFPSSSPVSAQALPRVARPAQWGPLSPAPFIGRAAELAALGEEARWARFLVVRGGDGVGKTRLAAELCADPRRLGATRAAAVKVERGDRLATVSARAERALGVWPGGLGDALATQAALLVLDDAHLLGDDARRVGHFVSARGAGRVVVLTRETWPGAAEPLARADFLLEGLDERDALALWAHFDEISGEVERAAFDRAFLRSRGYPAALAREHARARLGLDAWDGAGLSERARRALEVFAVFAGPLSPAGAAALDPAAGAEETVLAELAACHVVTPHVAPRPGFPEAQPDGLLVAARAAAERALAGMSPDRRAALERASAELWACESAGDPVDNLRRVVRHYLAAGDAGQAADILATGFRRALARGGAEDLDALIREVDALGAGNATLRAARFEIARRAGRVAEALELAEREVGGDTVVDPVELARLYLRAGEVETAAEMLASHCDDADADVRGEAAAALSELRLLEDDPQGARDLAGRAFARDRAGLSGPARASLHRALASVEAHEGCYASARANLARAAGAACEAPVAAARVELSRARCLTFEGRVGEAAAALDSALSAAAELGDVALAQEARAAFAIAHATRGERAEAERALRNQLAWRRSICDELGVLEAEVALAEVALARGDLAAAREHARVSAEAAGERELWALARRARIVLAAAAAEASPGERAWEELSVQAGAARQQAAKVRALAYLALSKASAGEATAADLAALTDDVDVARAQTRLALARGARSEAEAAARQTLLAAERLRRGDEATSAIAVLARLSLAQGDRDRAASRAHRALARARERCLPRAHATALLVASALAREEGDGSEALRLAREAASAANGAGLPALESAARQAVRGLSGQGRASSSDQEASEVAAGLAAGLLLDVGLTARCPYRIVFASGEGRRAADSTPERLDFASRSLVIDAVSQAVWRKGEKRADLRRRSLLRRLLYLFATNPGRGFSKEQIVERVWEVEYHPLRHDAALFTNIMRARRLLGEDGAELLKVTEAGYAFTPADDFLYIEIAEDGGCA